MSDPVSWAPEVKVIDNGDNWSRNSLRFASEQEALSSAANLFERWTLCIDFRAAPASEPVNYRIVGGRMEEVK